ncbi:hypothetical protein BH11PLA1_BH11PLA1_23940 [soil metagenome]
MIHRSSLSVAALALSLTAAAAFAGTPNITPISYDMANGDGNAHSGAFNYWDDTYNGLGATTTDRAPLTGGLGQLTDGIIGGNDWAADLGEGPAQRWVGWNSFAPVITFHLGGLYHLNGILVHANNFNSGGVSLFANCMIELSTDGGANYGAPTLFTPSAGNFANTDAQYLQVFTGGPGINATEVRLTLTGSNVWLFIDEVTLQGFPVPAPSAVALGALSLFAASRRRR